jgi:hypothetical protein
VAVDTDPDRAGRRVAAPAVLTDVLDRIDRDDVARAAMWLVWPFGIAVLFWVGRDQWFVRDDWAFLFSRRRFREVGGLDTMLLQPQDGHWMTWPILTFHAIRAVFGIGSYLPYLIVLWLTHLGIVLLAREWMRRLGVSAWTTTLMTAVLFVFGAGWENLLFAVQIVYNFSLLAFLAHTLLVDHEGPVDRRDWAGAGISLIGVSSSGFGPFFGFGVGLLLALRRRWTAAAIAVVPQALAWSWWWLTWGADPAGEPGNAGVRFVVSFVQFGVWSTFGSLVGTGLLAWSAFLLCVAMIVWPATDAARRAPMIAFLATALVMFAGIGLRREVFGSTAAGWPRYQYMAAMIVAPVLAVGLDQARRFASWARWIPRVLLVIAVARNTGWMVDGGNYWSGLAEGDRRVFSLVAGSDARSTVPPDGYMSDVSPDVQIRNLPELVDADAITPIDPASPDDQAALDRAIQRARETGLLPSP